MIHQHQAFHQYATKYLLLCIGFRIVAVVDDPAEIDALRHQEAGDFHRMLRSAAVLEDAGIMCDAEIEALGYLCIDVARIHQIIDDLGGTRSIRADGAMWELLCARNVMIRHKQLLRILCEASEIADTIIAVTVTDNTEIILPIGRCMHDGIDARKEIILFVCNLQVNIHLLIRILIQNIMLRAQG